MHTPRRSVTTRIVCETAAERRARRRGKAKAAASTREERRRENLAAHPQRRRTAAAAERPLAAEEYWAWRCQAAAELKDLGRAQPHASRKARQAWRAPPQLAALHQEAAPVRRHAITGKTAVKSLDAQKAQLMAELQYRDITPEDYELLLELDAKIQPKYGAGGLAPRVALGGGGRPAVSACAAPFSDARAFPLLLERRPTTSRRSAPAQPATATWTRPAASAWTTFW